MSTNKTQLDEFIIVPLLAKWMFKFVNKYIRKLGFEAYSLAKKLSVGIRIPKILYPILKRSPEFGKLLGSQQNEYYQFTYHEDSEQLNEFLGVSQVMMITKFLGFVSKAPKGPGGAKVEVGQSPEGDYGIRIKVPESKVPSAILSAIKALPFYRDYPPRPSEQLTGFVDNKSNKSKSSFVKKVLGAPMRALSPAGAKAKSIITKRLLPAKYFGGKSEEVEYGSTDILNKEGLESIVFSPPIWNSQFGHNVILDETWVPIDNLVEWDSFNKVNEDVDSIKRDILKEIGKGRYQDNNMPYPSEIKYWHNLKNSLNESKKNRAIELYSEKIREYIDELNG